MKHLIKSFATLLLLCLLSTPALAAADNSQVVFRGPTTAPKMALTFDDGGDPARVEQVLATLEAYNAKATFFFLGSFIDAHPALMKKVTEQGHDVGNHSYNHPDFSKASDATVLQELASAGTAYQKATGQAMQPFVRPPYGAYNRHTTQLIAQAGYAYTIMWDVDTNDWRGKSADELVKHVLANTSNGRIVLMHTTASSNAHRALPEMIAGLQAKGYSLVTISDLLGLPGKNPPPPSISYIEWFNNLLCLKHDAYRATADEVIAGARANGWLTTTPTDPWAPLSKSDAQAYTNLAFPGKEAAIAAIFAQSQFTPTGLPALTQALSQMP